MRKRISKWFQTACLCLGLLVMPTLLLGCASISPASGELQAAEVVLRPSMNQVAQDIVNGDMNALTVSSATLVLQLDAILPGPS